MFVENTKDGELARELSEVMSRIKGILGYNIKTVERFGIPLKLMFALSMIGEGGECGHEDCITCILRIAGEKCNILYENICRI